MTSPHVFGAWVLDLVSFFTKIDGNPASSNTSPKGGKDGIVEGRIRCFFLSGFENVDTKPIKEKKLNDRCPQVFCFELLADDRWAWNPASSR